MDLSRSAVVDREVAHTELGFEVLDRIFAKLGDKIEVEREAKLEGRAITCIVGRSRGNKKNEENKDQNQESTAQES